MTVQIRQNIYAAYLDGEATAMEAIRSLCDDYEELDKAYKDYEGLRNQTREQMSHVVDRIGGKVEVKGFGMLTITAPTISEGYDKAKIRDLIMDLVADYPDIAARLAACATKSARSGGLRIEREKPRTV